MTESKMDSSEQPLKRVLIAALQGFLPEESLLFDEEDLRPFESDGLSHYQRLPMIVCLPQTVEQVQKILALCYDLRVPVVARGAGTGLSGGALPLKEGVVLSLAKFTRILEVDAVSRLARVEPGVLNLAISQAAEPHGLYYAPDPSSQIACTIGGNVAENAGGVHCLKYGLTVHNVMGLKVLTMDGQLLEMGGKSLDSPGYDLLALMHGSEGLLGIIIEVTVKLLPKPQLAKLIMATFDDAAIAAAAVSRIIAAGIIPAGLEMMDRLAIRAVEEFVHAGYPLDADAILLCELDGQEDEVQVQIARVQTILQKAGAVHLEVAANEQHRLRLWAGRKAAFPAMGRLAPDYYCMDGTIPRRKLPEVLKQIARWSEEYGLAVANVFHAGDGNLHPLILYDASKPGEMERVEAFGSRILELCIEVGGTVTGEHGVGVEKLAQMCIQFGEQELMQFHAIKDALDARGLLNPGKAVPTLHRCAEFGAMHVHKGQLPFPELERF